MVDAVAKGQSDINLLHQGQSFALFKVENSPLKERESSKECSLFFLLTKESFAVRNCPSKNSTLFSSRRGLACFENMQPGKKSLWRIFRYISYFVVMKIIFLKTNLCICKLFIDVLFILTSALKKNYKMLPDLRLILCWILPCAQPIFLAWTDPRSS